MRLDTSPGPHSSGFDPVLRMAVSQSYGGAQGKDVKVVEQMGQAKNARTCPVCDGQVPSERLYEYSACPSCDSYVYTSDQAAEADNQRFYDKWDDRRKPLTRHTIKKKIFKFFARKDKAAREDEYRRLAEIDKRIDRVFQEAAAALEIGFGEGRTLVRWIASGCNMYGLDLSPNLVSSFQQRYPQYGERVSVGTHSDRKVSAVYCSALLEHLDDPQHFIDGVSSSLDADGVFVINSVPVVGDRAPTVTVEEDISFWKPCHRIVFSQVGLVKMFEKKGYTLVDHAAVDIFNYRLLSQHVKHGYAAIVELRNAHLKAKELPGVCEYIRLCRAALKTNSLAYSGAYIFQKG